MLRSSVLAGQRASPRVHSHAVEPHLLQHEIPLFTGDGGFNFRCAASVIYFPALNVGVTPTLWKKKAHLSACCAMIMLVGMPAP